MKRVIEAEFETTAKKFETALNRFFKKYPELDYWKEQFEYMYEHNIDFTCDNIFADGTTNENWSWALHLVINDLVMNDDSYYFCVIERA